MTDTTPVTAPDTDKEKPEKPFLKLTTGSLTLVNPEQLAANQRARAGRPVVERSKEQKIIDELVKAAHKKWVEAGKPAKFAESPGGSVTVPKTMTVLVERAIRKAGVLHDLSIRFGVPVESDGNVTVIFRASDRPARPVPAAENAPVEN